LYLTILPVALSYSDIESGYSVIVVLEDHSHKLILESGEEWLGCVAVMEIGIKYMATLGFRQYF
jgi:hypothetical protein